MITIKRNTNGDTRVAKKVPTINEFRHANAKHIAEVNETMEQFAKVIRGRGFLHDFTKTSDPNASQFYLDFADTLRTGAKFTSMEWYQTHIVEERHHLLDRCPEDVNLIDVIEMICDCVCAGLARRGDVSPVEIDASILTKAVANTAKMIESWCELEVEG